MKKLKEFLTQSIGLGDIAYWVFRPVVYMIDWVWGTDLKDCDKCKIRRIDWNSAHSAELWEWTFGAFIGMLLILTVTLE